MRISQQVMRASVTAAAVAVIGYLPASAAPVSGGITTKSVIPATTHYPSASSLSTVTPIKHLVVLFQENNSFDHYFGTYPKAANRPGEKAWHAKAGTPKVNGLTSALLNHNPNSADPLRLSPQDALTCDMDHGYHAEQLAEDGGLMDKFVQYTTGKSTSPYQFCPLSDIVMGHYDGNTVTALWNYAQNFALNDRSFGSEFGPSTVGAVNLVSGDTGTVICGPSSVAINTSPCTSSDPVLSGKPGTDIGDTDPIYDACSDNYNPTPSKDMALSGPNIGTMLDTAKVSWGWFQGGFDTCMSASPPKHGPVLALKAQHPPATLADDPTDQTTDYSPHHEPFQYYSATANPDHLAPTSTAMIGSQDQANHQYSLTSFWKAADGGDLPAVSFLKAPRYDDGHAENSDPLDEQYYIVNTINQLERLKTWPTTAVIIMYDDSDGWYDHVRGTIVNHSNSPIDVDCGTTPAGAQPGRCGYGPRLPLLVVSPYARRNFVDNTLTDQTSIIRFIETNWLKGKRVSSESFDNWAGTLNNMFAFHAKTKAPIIYMNPTTGVVTKTVTVK